MLDYKIYNLLVDIIKVTYTDEEYPNNKFSKFFIKLIPKEMKTIHGRYFFHNKNIEVFNLSRKSEHIITTTIHEVAHHIDYCLRKNTDHSKEFYQVMKNLLVTAMSMKIISVEDILSETDSSDKDRLIKYFGDIDTWELKNVKYKEDKIIIKVKNSFSIKNILSKRGYTYSGIEQAWIKEIDKDNVDNEKDFLINITSIENVIISSGNDIEISAVYYICVHNSFNHKEFLQANGYIFNGYNLKRNSWNKKINANDLKDEKRKLSKLDGVLIKVVGKK